MEDGRVESKGNISLDDTICRNPPVEVSAVRELNSFMRICSECGEISGEELLHLLVSHFVGLHRLLCFSEPGHH